MKNYYFTIEHIAENETVRFSIKAESLKEAIKIATSLNPRATPNGAVDVIINDNSVDDGLPF